MHSVDVSLIIGYYPMTCLTPTSVKIVIIISSMMMTPTTTVTDGAILLMKGGDIGNMSRSTCCLCGRDIGQHEASVYTDLCMTCAARPDLHGVSLHLRDELDELVAAQQEIEEKISRKSRALRIVRRYLHSLDYNSRW